MVKLLSNRSKSVTHSSSPASYSVSVGKKPL